MPEPRTPCFSFTTRLGHTNFTVNVSDSENEKATYQDKLLELIRSEAADEQQQKDETGDHQAA